MAKNDTKTKEKKKRRFSSVFFRVAVAGVAAYLLIYIINGQVEVAHMQKELDAVTKEVTAQQELNAELQHMLESGDQDAYVERMAREKLGYAYPDERIFIDITGE